LRHGEGSDAVLLIHGFAGDLDNWLLNHSVLAAERTVYALDLPGHGQSSKEVGQGTLDELADIVSKWIEALSLPKLNLVGHSLGGAVALKLSLQHPDQVRSCTLIATAGLGEEIDGEYIRGIVNADRRNDLTALLHRLFADRKHVTHQLVANMLKFKRLDGVCDALRRISDSAFLDGRQTIVMRDQLRQLSIPLLVLWGKQDRIIPVSHAEGLPDSILVNFFEKCGHMVHVEAASDVNRTIARFLNDV
jgi:pyruvate dehydrogenase E2 component (dihydrolipoamide acetyltransferase)